MPKPIIELKRLVDPRLVLSSFLLFLIAACSNQVAYKDSAPMKPAGPAAAVQTTSYQAVGTVKGMNETTPSIEVDHEEVKGLMPAMQMEFHIKDKSLLSGLSIGDRIDFTIENGVGGLKIVAISKRS